MEFNYGQLKIHSLTMGANLSKEAGAKIRETCKKAEEQFPGVKPLISQLNQIINEDGLEARSWSLNFRLSGKLTRIGVLD